MNPQAERSTQEVLAGLVERVTYHNAENGFCVLRAKARGHREVVTVVGHAATIAELICCDDLSFPQGLNIHWGH
jgi:exodeoxyribonuclease V alpha subunit